MSNCIEHGYGPGYRQVWREGKVTTLHRSVMARKLGIPLAALQGKVVRHTCDNKCCINPDHLVLGTQYQNVMDAVERGLIKRGASARQAKLSDADVAAVRAEYNHGGIQQKELAAKYGVSSSTMHAILKGKTYQSV